MPQTKNNNTGLVQVWKDYELLDSGDFEKLERFGKFCLRRPEPKALWHKSMSEAQWAALTHTRFKPGAGFAKAGKEDSGTWEMLKKMDEQWKIHYMLSEGREHAGSEGRELTLRLGLTSFKHVGVFPEQASNWDWIYSRTRDIAKCLGGGTAGKPKVLNLFAYTGAASLAAKAAGADVTHLDSVKQVVTWGRQNMELSGMQDIRWVVEDAMKFVRREVRRGNHYNGIILDPPAYGHGPDGEKWKLDECLLEMLGGVADLLDKDNFFMVLNLYSNGYSATLADTLVRQSFNLGACDGSNLDGKRQSANLGACDRQTSLECGELVLSDSFGKKLPLSVYARLWGSSIKMGL